MKKFSKSELKQSIVSSLKADYKKSVEALFDRMLLPFPECNGFDSPSVKHQYVADDYQGMLLKKTSH